MNKAVTSEKVLVGSDFNGHVGSDMGGLVQVLGRGGAGGEGGWDWVNKRWNDQIVGLGSW